LPPERQTVVRNGTYGNLVLDETIRLVPNGRITASLIPWARWPRILAAGIVAARPTFVRGSPNRVTIQMLPGHARVFSRAITELQLTSDATLRFRRRPLLDTTVPVADRESPFFTLGPIDPDSDTIEGEASATDVEDWIGRVANNLFPEERIILFAPRRTAALDQALVHPAVGQIIEAGTLGGPLNRLADSECVIYNPDTNPEKDVLPIRLAALPANLRRPLSFKMFIGLIDGGYRYSCGVYHPACACLMRTVELEDDVPLPPSQERKAASNLMEFCHVCRYLLVDQFAPTLHGVIDELYTENYPRE
jgi:hypothetical protein